MPCVGASLWGERGDGGSLGAAQGADRFGGASAAGSFPEGAVFSTGTPMR